MKPREIGEAGERLAARHYEARGYTLLAQNYHSRHGEVDLILKTGDTLVFCEVKTRGPRAWERPAAWVNAKKQRRVILAALAWLQAQGLAEAFMRFDVAEVLMDGGGGAEVNVIESAFDAGGGI